MEKKILFCSSFIDQVQTGSAIFAQLFIEWAKDRGIDLDIISSEKSNRKVIPLVKSNRLYARIPILENYHRSYIYYKTVESTLLKKEYDFVFFNSVTESLHSSKLLKKCKVRAFLHDENFMNDYKENASIKRRIYRNAMHKHEMSACQFLDKILTNSRYMKSQIESIYDIHPLRVSYSYFRSFDLDKKNLSPINDEGNGKINILFIKHDYERGGLEFLINAIRKLGSERFFLKIIGVPSKKKRALSKLLSGIDYEIINQRSREEIPLDYQKCDLFCVPSQSEALGLANLEAMSFEKPVISFDIPVMKELNESYKIMFLAKKANVDDLMDQIRICIEDKVIRNEYIQSAKNFVEEKISKKMVYENLDHFFGY